MARPPDKPGEYRVREQSDGWFRVSGMKKDGTRVKHQRFGTKQEADTYVALNFESVPLDDWGLPGMPSEMKVTDDTAAKFSATIGVPSPTVSKAVEDKKELEKRHKRAMGLSELIGTGWAAGTVYMGRRITSNAGKEPVNPDTKQVGNLADSAKETIQGWFGEKEISPWVMTILLTLGIPIAMLIQSPPKKVDKANLQSVP